MTKRHFIDLADHLRLEIKPELDSIAFDLYGKCGPNGGKRATEGGAR
jgi:hypothetical protein